MAGGRAGRRRGSRPLDSVAHATAASRATQLDMTQLDPRSLLVAGLEDARAETLAASAGFAPEAALRGAEWGLNPLVWLLGHLGYSQQRLCFGYTTGREIAPPGWRALFARGSKPGAPSTYPELERLHSELARMHGEVLAFARGLSDADLGRPLREPIVAAPRARTWADALARAALHEAQHAGQILMLRRLTRLPRPV